MRIAAAGIADISYQYDLANNLQSITNNLASAENRTLHYDGLHRLVTAHGPWGVAPFKYDPLGRRATTWATRYEVWRKFNNNPWVKLQNNATTRYSYTASSLGIYQVYVKACNTSGCSGATPVVKTDVRKYLPGGGCKASADNPVKCP